MNEKEMIKEMANIIKAVKYEPFNDGKPTYTVGNQMQDFVFDLIAEELIKQGYRKPLESSIVLNAKDIETTCKHCRSKYEKIIEELQEQRDRQAYIAEDLIQEKHRWTEQAVKETAEKILNKCEEFYKMTYHKSNAMTRLIDWIKNTFGIEIKE